MQETDIQSIDEIDGYLSAQKAAELLQCSESYIRKLVFRRRLDAVRFAGRVLMIKKSSVESFAKTQVKEWPANVSK